MTMIRCRFDSVDNRYIKGGGKVTRRECLSQKNPRLAI